ncbi:MAG: hypothetical protein ACXAD7_23150 [Candidatus Kariarchaeaceae archaeon]|jgi:5'-3' exonuclease
MSNKFVDQIEDQTGGLIEHTIKLSQWEITEQDTPLSHEDDHFKGLLKFGTLEYNKLINDKVEEFRLLLEENREYHEGEDLPLISQEKITLMEEFFHTIYERQIQQNLVLPLFSISYYEGFNGSIELSLIRPNYRILINISSEQILYSIIHRSISKRIKKGSNTVESIYDLGFIDSLISDIKYFENGF